MISGKPEHFSRREFARRAGMLAVAGVFAPESQSLNPFSPPAVKKKITIRNVSSNFEREPLNPYRFKGSAITDSWQAIAMMESDTGIRKVGLGTQGVLWSDSKVFAAHSESAGNALMYAMSEHALQMIKGTSFHDPVQLLDDILPEVLAYGRKITGNPDLRKTFALNALVCVDNAAWLLYAQENSMKQFDEMVPAAYRPGLSYRHEKVASIPSFSVGTAPERHKQAADGGYFIL